MTSVGETPQLDQRALALNAFPDDDRPEVVGVPERELPRHLRVAPKVSNAVARRRRRARFALLGVAAISAASMFLLVAFHVFAVQSAFQLDKLDRELTAQQREYGHLREKVDRASSPEAVQTGAERLGMVRSQNVTVLHVPGIPSSSPNSAFPIPPKTPYAPLGTPDANP